MGQIFTERCWLNTNYSFIHSHSMYKTNQKYEIDLIETNRLLHVFYVVTPSNTLIIHIWKIYIILNMI